MYLNNLNTHSRAKSLTQYATTTSTEYKHHSVPSTIHNHHHATTGYRVPTDDATRSTLPPSAKVGTWWDEKAARVLRLPTARARPPAILSRLALVYTMLSYTSTVLARYRCT